MKTSQPYITCMCTSLKESTDQFVSSSTNTLSSSRLDYSLPNCENELICKCFSNGTVKVESFNQLGFVVRLKEEEGFKYVSCTFSIISNRRMLILARSDNKLIFLLEGFIENSPTFNQVESFPIPSSITCIEVNQFRTGATMMNSLLVGCYDGSLFIVHLILKKQEEQFDITSEHFANCEGHKAIGIIKVKEEAVNIVNGIFSIVYIVRTDGVLQICRLTSGRNDSLNFTSNIETLNTVGCNSSACALSFCDLVIEGKDVRVVALSGMDYFSIYYSLDNFATIGRIRIIVPPNRIITTILALRLERDESDMISLLFGDDYGQLYRVKVTDLQFPSISVEPKNYLGKPQPSMVIHCVMVRNSDRNSIIFTTRKDEVQSFK